MKKSSTFTLVRKVVSGSKTATLDKPIVTSFGETNPERKRTASKNAFSSPEMKAVLDSVKRVPKAAKTFKTLDPKFQTALASSFVTKAAKQGVRAKPSVSPNILSVARDLVRQTKVLRVGVLDLGAWIGELPKLLEKLNGSQSLFTIFEVQAPIPAGLLKTPAGMAQWAYLQTGKPINMSEHGEWMPHVIDDEFFAAGENIRNDLGLDYLVGMTPAMVAGTEEDGSIYWNHRCSELEKVILLSTTDLRRFSELAERPYEAAIGTLLVSGLLVSINSELDYHHKDTGCIFDYNSDRESIVTTIKKMSVDSQCLQKMTEEQRLVVQSMLSALKRMKRRAT